MKISNPTTSQSTTRCHQQTFLSTKAPSYHYKKRVTQSTWNGCPPLSVGQKLPQQRRLAAVLQIDRRRHTEPRLHPCRPRGLRLAHEDASIRWITERNHHQLPANNSTTTIRIIRVVCQRLLRNSIIRFTPAISPGMAKQRRPKFFFGMIPTGRNNSKGNILCIGRGN